jgi:hypothetical protein
LLRAAAVGGVAYKAGKARANAAEQETDDPNAPQPGDAPDPAAAADPAETPLSADESMAELTKLKGLLDAGVLTQDEFDAQKQKILQSM